MSVNRCPHSIPTREKVDKAVKAIQERIGDVKPEVAIICGSGLGKMVDQLTNTKRISYEDVPFLPPSTVKGHVGQFVFGTFAGKQIVLMQGRIHPYEGKSPSLCALPVWIMKELGATLLVATAATGALNPDYQPGDFMIIQDHINTAGSFAMLSPLVGPNDERDGCRFPSMTSIYSPSIKNKLIDCAKELNLADIMRVGVYFYACGPAFETIAEARAYRLLGGDVAGMSMVHETTIAKYLGMDVLGISLVTNRVCMDYDNIYHSNHLEVLEISEMRSPQLMQLIELFLKRWNTCDGGENECPKTELKESNNLQEK